MLSFLLSPLTHRRVKTPTGWVINVYHWEDEIRAYREALLDGHALDQQVLTYTSPRMRRDFKRVLAGFRAGAITVEGGPETPRPDPEVKSLPELREEKRAAASFWYSVRMAEQELQARRLSGR